ncbi:RNA polymerase sigma factor [Spirosoma montaniterrae]|uniref:RNA polymerase subunit sigma-24 n=1 Tax=Spirosoma montaniterrae TaxID=1178516 RepID=A0A1P9X1X4_9BACT|nr:sigma-70 family RNA polymerase sigma factor [Spirosoma montaniterrae]AQG81595.1 RNA polymerase subunit sigma-24 [Spirosoma montaniterrae]
MKLTLNDEEVIRQYLTTRPNDCFETLYNRYVQKVYKRCYSITKDSEKAQDFTHDIFIRMFSRLDRFQERSTFSTWLYSISYNYCMDQLKLTKRNPTVTLEEELDHEPSTASDESETMEYGLQQLARAMNALAPQEAMILRLKYEEGLDVQQIAAKLNLKDSAVKMRLKRSRDKVRQLCGPSLWG